MQQSLLTRIFLKALLATAVYVALLVPVGALAGDGADATSTPEVTTTTAPVETATEVPAPVETATEAPTEAPTEAATEAPADAPTETATATPDETSTPVASPSPEATATSQPAPTETATPAPTATATPDADGTQEELPKVHHHKGQTFTDPVVACLVQHDKGNGHDSSPSSSDRECIAEAKKEIKKHHRDAQDDPAAGGIEAPAAFAPDGTPTLSNPTLSLATVGAAPIGVPNFFIDKFRIPPFLLPIYQAAGTEYGIRWEVLAAINEIETDYGRNLNISTAGALGWMQFMPSTWKMYGVDANKDGVKDPFNPVDAIFAAARYLKAAGGDKDIQRAIFAYNHADWYVDSVLLRARTIGGLPADFVGSLTGLTQARFPVAADSRYAGAVDTRAAKKFKPGMNAAMPVESSVDRTNIDIFSKQDAPVIAVNDGKIVDLGSNEDLGRFIKLQDSFGNVFTYAHLGKVASTYPVPVEKHVDQNEVKRELHLPGADDAKSDPAPKAAASSTGRKAAKTNKRAAKHARAAKQAHAAKKPIAKERVAANAPEPVVSNKDRLFAHPKRAHAAKAGGDLQIAADSYHPETGAILKLNPRDFTPKRMRKGAHIIAGTVLGHIGRVDRTVAPHMTFMIRPAGKGAPLIDPKPILDGWKLLESTAIYRAEGRNPFVGPDAEQPSIGQILLMSKEALQREVLNNPSISIYECGRNDIRVGAIDRRVLATLAFLASSGLKPTVTSLQCGHGYLTASGNVSEHSTGSAVDIAAVNGIPIVGHQGPGSITETTIQRLLTLQGTMKPHQIISLMTFPDADNTLSLPDHYDHIHVGFRPLYGANTREARQLNTVLKPGQWIRLIDRLGEVANPEVATAPSKFALKVAPKVDGGD